MCKLEKSEKRINYDANILTIIIVSDTHVCTNIKWNHVTVIVYEEIIMIILIIINKY